MVTRLRCGGIFNGSFVTDLFTDTFQGERISKIIWKLTKLGSFPMGTSAVASWILDGELAHQSEITPDIPKLTIFLQHRKYAVTTA